MFQFEIIYKPSQSYQALSKKHTYIRYGPIISGETKFLGQEICTYENKKWISKLSVDAGIFINNIEGLWIQLYNQSSNEYLMDPIKISGELIQRKQQPFKWQIPLNEEITLERLGDPYSSIYNIYPQQYQTSIDIISQIKEGHKHIIMVSQMQMGKTGCAKSIAYNLINSCGYLPQKLFFICGMNDNNLLDQAKMEFKGLIPVENILFSKKLQKMTTSQSSKSTISHFSHAVIFVDESHYASQKNSLVYKFLQNNVGITADGFSQTWENNDVIVISISATPMAEIANLNQPQSDKKFIILKPGNDYYGVIDMEKKGLIRQSFNLNKIEESEKFIHSICEIYKEQSQKGIYRYCIVRLGSVLSKDRLEFSIRKSINDKVDFINYYSGSNGSTLPDFNSLIDKKPHCLTIIWIYDSLRAGKQLNTENIHMVHDSHCCAPDVAAQGLAGRLCGYGKHNHNVICYTNMKSINKFIDWIKSQYDPGRIPSGSKDIVNGFDANNNSHWQKNIPIIFKMTQDLINYCLQYRLEHGKTRYNNEFKEYCKTQIIQSNKNNMTIFEVLNTYYPSKNGGFMIIDHLNKQNSVDKHWETNYNAAINNKSTQGFVTPSTKPIKDKLYYIFLNMIPHHKSFGMGILCYKEYIDDLSVKKSYVSTKSQNIYNPISWGHTDTKIPIKPKIAIKKKIFLKSQIATKLNSHPS